MTIEYVYSHDRENFCDENEHDAAISTFNCMRYEEYAEYNAGDKITVYRAVKVPQTASGLVSGFMADYVIEQMQCTADDECGEWAEDFTRGISDEAKAELLAYIEQWADKHCDISFYGVTDIEEVEVVVTQDMLD